MSELVILLVSRTSFESIHKAAAKGDEAALHELETLWNDYDEVPCFLCDAITPRAEIFSKVMREFNDSAMLIVLPLCKH